MANFGSSRLCRCETHPVWPGRWQEHQRRRPQAGSGLGTGSLSSQHTARDSGISEESGLKCMSNSNQQGDIFGEIGSKATTTNSNLLSTTSSWCFCHWYTLPFVALYFVVASIQETVGGILFINHVIVSVQHCHNNEIKYNPFACHQVCGFIVVIPKRSTSVDDFVWWAPSYLLSDFTITTIWYSFVIYTVLISKPC